MMKFALAAFAGLLGVANAQTCENVEEYTVRALPSTARRGSRARTHSETHAVQAVPLAFSTSSVHVCPGKLDW